MAPTLHGTYVPIADDADDARMLQRRRQLMTVATGLIAAAVVVAHLSIRGQPAGEPQLESAGAVPISGMKDIALSTSASRPHIILVTLDDVGWDDFGDTSTDMSQLTPHMTSLANHGVTLTRYYGQSLCTPARASLHSGKFVHRIGFTTLKMEIEITPMSNYSVPINNRLMGQRLQNEGNYSTFFVGKWNIGHCNDVYAPWNRGFDYFLGYFSSGINYQTYTPDTTTDYYYESRMYTLYDLTEGNASGLIGTGAQFQTKEAIGNYTDYLFATAAVNRVLDHAATYGADPSDKPLFGHMAFHGPHDDGGSDVLPDYLLESAARADGGANAVDMLSELESQHDERRYKFGRALMATDGAFGMVHRAMNETGMIEGGAVIVVMSDNGGWPCGEHMRGSNFPLRGCKFHYHDGALRVPAFVYASPYGASANLMSDSVRGSFYDGMMHHVDWLPTFASLAGITIDDDPDLDGVDQWDAIAGSVSESPRSEILFALDATYTVMISGRFKFIFDTPNSTWWGDANDTTTDASKCNYGNYISVLYDIVADPTERDNLCGDFAASHSMQGGCGDYTDVVENLTARALTLYNEQTYETVSWGSAGAAHPTATKAFHEAGGYVVPWGCPVRV